ncbi:MAG: mandelate racemase/muconate lactonizing enzyme family protein [Pseudomonadota bacterium]
MKILAVTPFLIAPRPSPDGWSRGQTTLLVKLETSEGLIGWGEAYALSHRQDACNAIIAHLAEALIALSDASPRAFLAMVVAPMTTKHPGIDYAAAASALEIALWDLTAKSAGLPLHAMLGGAVTDRVPIYANAWDHPVQTPEAIAERCARLCHEGYRAVKIYPLRQSTRARAEATVRLTREAIGAQADMMLDFAVQSDPRHALQAARTFAPYDPYWIEEPVAGDNIPALAEFRARTDIRITTGERQAGTRHCRDLLHHRAADVLNPDVAGAGGILTLLEVGAMAAAHDVMISPHSWNSTTVAYMAMLHLCAVMPNACYGELYYDYLELGGEFARCDTTLENGCATLPQTPGLGVEIDEDALHRLCV